MIYQNLKKNERSIVSPTNKINYHFVDGAFVEITGNRHSKFLVKFIDGATEEVIHETEIETNHWTKTSRKYFVDWRIEVYENNTLVNKTTYNASGKRVFISLDSSALGDTLAWIPYCLEFKKKHNCEVIVSTFHNNLFYKTYPELQFVKPGGGVENIYAMYNIGWFYDEHREPELPNTIPIQKTATNILGLEYKEIKPLVASKGTFVNKEYVTIATNSTTGCKFWTKEGWQEVINYLTNLGIEVINVSKERNNFDNCRQLEEGPIEDVIEVIAGSKFFIGLSSGLSWLAWALDKPVVMISNFTKAMHEFSCIRITNTTECHGCWNSPDYRFDKGDWNWCPIYKGTEKQHICQKSILGKDVIEKIGQLL